MKPTVGRIVLYTLTEQDANEINLRRTTGLAIIERINNSKLSLGHMHPGQPVPPMWPLGAQAHIGNEVAEGHKYPMVVVRTWGEEAAGVNGQVLLDGNDTFWAPSRVEGDKPGTWAWPERV